MSSNYPPGVDGGTFGAPWNDQAYKFEATFSMGREDLPRLKAMDDMYIIDISDNPNPEDCLLVVRLEAGFSMPGPCGYSQGQLMDTALEELRAAMGAANVDIYDEEITTLEND